MGRILYGVMGDAGGHISRSLAIAHRLRKHDVVFVGGGRVGELARCGYPVVSVPAAGTKLSAQRVAAGRTVAGAVSALAQRRNVIARLMAVIEDFDPDLILTDYEYFLPLAARRLGRPCISVDRQHALTHCRYRPPAGNLVSRLLTLGIVRALYSAASHYLVCSFVPMRPIDPHLTEVFPPVLREQVAEIRPTLADHAVVYLQGTSLRRARELLAGRRRRFLVYGFGDIAEEGNLCFRPYSAETFLADLASCAYVISNGGHNLISEALHYRKPLLCFPIGLLYEQLLNAHLLAETGYGSYHHGDAGAAGAVEAFEARLPQFRARVAEYATWDHDVVASRLEALIASRGVP